MNELPVYCTYYVGQLQRDDLSKRERYKLAYALMRVERRERVYSSIYSDSIGQAINSLEARKRLHEAQRRSAWKAAYSSERVEPFPDAHDVQTEVHEFYSEIATRFTRSRMWNLCALQQIEQLEAKLNEYHEAEDMDAAFDAGEFSGRYWGSVCEPLYEEIYRLEKYLTQEQMIARHEPDMSDLL